VLDAVGLHQRLEGAALCLTGEGRLDAQSLSGKALGGVARVASRQGVPVVALVGSAAEDAPRPDALGLAGWRLIAPDRPAAESMARAGSLLERAAEEVMRQWL
jgi:glycerate kinase